MNKSLMAALRRQKNGLMAGGRNVPWWVGTMMGPLRQLRQFIELGSGVFLRCLSAAFQWVMAQSHVTLPAHLCLPYWMSNKLQVA
jgi:hypothetical protein